MRTLGSRLIEQKTPNRVSPPSTLWLDTERFEIFEAYAYNMNSKSRREIRKIIYHHFEYIENAWNEFQLRKY